MEDKKIKWYMLAFMAFSTVWGFGNVFNLPTHYIQLISFAILVLFCWVASKGLNPLKKLATIAGGWCFAVTAICCLPGVWSTNIATHCLHIITPIILTCLGFILLAIKKREIKLKGHRMMAFVLY